MGKRKSAEQAEENPTPAVVAERVEESILVVRGRKVLLDSQLAAFYGVETRVLTQAVKRNSGRFPGDFMFQLSEEEWEGLRSQLVILKGGRGQHRKYLPYAFTEQGGGDVVGRVAERSGGGGEYRDHAGVRTASAIAFGPQGACRATDGVGEADGGTRPRRGREVQEDIRDIGTVVQPARSASAEDWVSWGDGGVNLIFTRCTDVSRHLEPEVR